MVSDKDIASEIRAAAPGGTRADVKAAWAVVRGRLNSRDDSETAAAFDEVLGRAELEPTAGDREAAEEVFDIWICPRYICDTSPEHGCTYYIKEAERANKEKGPGCYKYTACRAALKQLVPIDALSAARGNRAELEAAADRWKNWLPTAENINGLPEPIRKFIHDIETNADPAQTVRENTILKDTVAALAKRVEELEVPPGDTEAAEKVYREIWPGAPNDEGVRADIDLFAAALAAARQAGERETLEMHKAGCDAYELMEARVKALEAAAREGLNPHCNVCELGREGRCHSGCNWFKLAALVKAEEVETVKPEANKFIENAEKEFYRWWENYCRRAQEELARNPEGGPSVEEVNQDAEDVIAEITQEIYEQIPVKKHLEGIWYKMNNPEPPPPEVENAPQ